MEQTINNRLIHVDIIKSFLIIFVIIGHSYVDWTEYIYWFHMPVFFMVGGYFLKTEGGVLNYCKKRIIPLFLPYLLFGLLDMVLRNRLNVKAIVAFLYGGRMSAGVYWFVPCLFLGCVGVLVIEKYIKSCYKKYIYTALLIVAVLESNFLIPKDTFDFPLYLNFPLNIDVVLLTIVYVRIGMWLRRVVTVNNKHNIMLFMISCLVFASALVVDFVGCASFELDMKYSDYTDILFIVIIPICAYIIFFQIARWTEAFPFIAKMFGEVGKCSMYIMYIHLILLDFIMIPIFGESYPITLYVILTIGVSILVRYLFEFSRRMLYPISQRNLRIDRE